MITKNEELLIDFVKWYWLMIQDKPYQISAEQVVEYFNEDKNG